MRITLRHLPARQAIAADEALLDGPAGHWWISTTRAVVVGVGLHHRLATVVDLERCRASEVEVIQRRAGGGALFLDANVLCGAVALPMASVEADVTESYRWLGDRLVSVLAGLGIIARRAEVDEARADIASLRNAASPTAAALLTTCYAGLSPHEVVVHTDQAVAKLVGLAQVRRRDAALFQFGVLLRDQSCLADYLRVADEAERDALRTALRRRTVGLDSLTRRSASEVAAAIVDAMPFEP
jgi:lipoate-protein ligase A